MPQLRNLKCLPFAAMAAIAVFLGCSDSATQPVPDEVRVSASAPVVQVGDSVILRASYRFGSTDQPGDSRVRWTTSDSTSFTVDRAGIGHALKYTGAPITVTANASGVTGTAEVSVLPTFDSLAVTVSARMAVGRTVHPTFAVSAAGSLGRTYAELPELSSIVSLSSSNKQAVAIEADGSLLAVAPGQSTIVATLLGKSTTVLVDVFSGYPVTSLSGSEKYNVSAVNDAGDIVAIETGGLNLLRRGAELTDLGSCIPSDINNADAIACTVRVDCGASCVATKAGILEGGALQLLNDAASSGASGISESGIVFGQARDSTGNTHVMVWDPAGTTYLNPDTFWAGSTYSVNSSGHGVQVLTADLYDGSVLVGRSFLVGLRAQSGRWSRGRDVNDSDDVVGTSENMAGAGTATVWRAATHWTPESPGYRATDAIGITESGAVVGHGRDGAYLSQDGRYTILADALADDSWTITQVVAVSHTKMIAAKAENASGVKGIVLIDIGSAP